MSYHTSPHLHPEPLNHYDSSWLLNLHPNWSSFLPAPHDSLTVPPAAKKILLIYKSHCTPSLLQTLQWCPLHLFTIVYKVLCKLVLVISLTFSLTLSSLMWFLTSHPSFLALPWNAKCAPIPGPLHMLFLLPGTRFLQIFICLTSSLPQRVCPSAIFSETPAWPLCVYTCTHTHGKSFHSHHILSPILYTVSPTASTAIQHTTYLPFHLFISYLCH